MNMFQNIGEFTPDSLIASPDFPILKDGIGLKAGQGVLKRGSLIAKGTDKAGYIAGGSGEVTSKVYGILTDDVDTGSEKTATNIPVTCYLTGVFNRDAILVAATATVDTFEDDAKTIGIYLREVQKY